MRGVAGYSFKDDAISDFGHNKLKEAIEQSADQFNGAYEYRKDNDIYLIAEKSGSLHVYGICTNKETGTPKGIIWGSDMQALMNIIQSVGFANEDITPYNIVPNMFYVIRNNDLYVLDKIKQGGRVMTPNGRGTIHSVDQLICVELDDDKSLLYEYDINEIEWRTAVIGE